MANFNTLIKRKQYIWLGLILAGGAAAVGGGLYLSDLNMSSDEEAPAQGEPAPDMTGVVDSSFNSKVEQHATTEMQATAADLNKRFDSLQGEVDLLSKARTADQIRIDKLSSDNEAMQTQLKALGVKPAISGGEPAPTPPSPPPGPEGEPQPASYPPQTGAAVPPPTAFYPGNGMTPPPQVSYQSVPVPNQIQRKTFSYDKGKKTKSLPYIPSGSFAKSMLIESLMKNTACTLSSRQCAFSSEEGTCLHEYATYSCETRTSGKQMICGGDVFCLDGECDKATSGKSNDFGQAVSELAALAAAGKDVAALNGVDVRAFTGKAKFCKKFAAGFSNCCKDSGWGQDVGLARCSSEEKALAKAKKDKLTVSIGEFCSKKVLGICLEKKRSYCQFDSKLAQIVQQQGRNGQLHIGFGGASSPDCRGITTAELQGIDFNKLDFTNFMDDLMKNQKIPENDVLTNKTKERIKEIMSQQSAQ